MSSLLRTSMRVSRTRPFTPTFSAIPRRFASSDYGSQQGGQEQGTNQKNPMKHMEHPGPESPAAKGKSASGSGSGSGSGSDSSSGSSGASKGGAEPKINKPESSGKEQSEDVKKHNQEMENRADKPVNQIDDKGEKVEKGFWEGDVGENVTNRK